MRKTTSTLTTAMFLALFLAAACADQDDGPEAETAGLDKAQPPAASAKMDSIAGAASSLMDQPVDFSSPEKVEESLQKIRQEVGEKEYKRVQDAIKYLLFYDLSVGQDKDKLYAKLNGKTPNEIIAGMRR